MDREEFQKAFGKLVAKAWADEEFKAKLLSEPMMVLQENEITIPDGVEVKVIENTDTTIHLILPAASVEEELSDDDLDSVSGGHPIDDM